MNAQRGYTLVEVVVVMVIASLVGLALVSFLGWSIQRSQEGRAKAHLQNTANVLFEDLARRVRNSTKVTYDAGTKKLAFAKGGVETGSLRIQGNQLLETDTLNTIPVVYKVGGAAVRLVEANSSFTVDTSQTQVGVDLLLEHDGMQFRLASQYLRSRN